MPVPAVAGEEPSLESRIKHAQLELIALVAALEHELLDMARGRIYRWDDISWTYLPARIAALRTAIGAYDAHVGVRPPRSL